MTHIDKAEALDPCPFCGGSKLGKTTHGLPMAPCVICRDCYASAPSVAAWSRRAALPARGVGVPEELAKKAIDNSIARLQALPDYAGRPAWEEVVAEEIRAALAPTDAAQAREAAAEAMAALSWAKANLQALSCRAGNEGAEFPIVDRALASLRLALIKEPSE